MRVLVALPIALLIALLTNAPLRADERTQKLAERLGREADAFLMNAPQVVGRETLHQRTLVPAPRPKIRVGKAVDRELEPIWQEREIVSQYGFAALGPAIHELRQVMWVEGKQVAQERKAQDELARLITGNDDQRKRRSLQQLDGVLKAAYFQASADVDYESAARAAGCTTADIAAHTTQNPSTKWKEVAAGVRANLAPYTIVKPARVKLTELVKPDAALDKSEPLPFVLEMEDATCI